MPTASDVMTRKVISVTPDTPVTEVARILYSNHISGLPVLTEDERLVGIVSEGDLMTHVGAVGPDTSHRSWWLGMFADSASSAAEYSRTHARITRDVMSAKVVTVDENTPLREVARLLEKKRIKRVPVMRGNQMVGILTRANLVQALASLPASPPAKADDQVIDEQINRQMAERSWGAFVNSIVEDSVVHLWGFVDSEEERRAVQILAENIAGVRRVEDHLSVRPARWDYSRRGV